MNAHAIRSDKSSIFDARSHLGWSRETYRRDKEGSTSPQHGSCRYVILFLCLKRPSSLVGVLWGTGATRPWQMFRDACPFASAYYVLILGIRTYKASNTRPIPNVHACDLRRWIESPGWQTRSMKWPTHNTAKGVASKLHNNTPCNLWSFSEEKL